MSYNYYLSEKLAEAHRQDLLREAEQQRRLSGLPKDHQSRKHPTVVKWAILVVTLVLVLAFFGPFLVHSMMSLDLYPMAYRWDPQALSQHVVAVHYHLQVAAVCLVA